MDSGRRIASGKGTPARGYCCRRQRATAEPSWAEQLGDIAGLQIGLDRFDDSSCFEYNTEIEHLLLLCHWLNLRWYRNCNDLIQVRSKEHRCDHTNEQQARTYNRSTSLVRKHSLIEDENGASTRPPEYRRIDQETRRVLKVNSNWAGGCSTSGYRKEIIFVPYPVRIAHEFH